MNETPIPKPDDLSAEVDKWKNTAALWADLPAAVDRLQTELAGLRAEIERWRDSNIRIRDEMEHQATRANAAEWEVARLREQLERARHPTSMDAALKLAQEDRK